jgi:hypothetical protein
MPVEKAGHFTFAAGVAAAHAAAIGQRFRKHNAVEVVHTRAWAAAKAAHRDCVAQAGHGADGQRPAELDGGASATIYHALAAGSAGDGPAPNAQDEAANYALPRPLRPLRLYLA